MARSQLFKGEALVSFWSYALVKDRSDMTQLTAAKQTAPFKNKF